MLRICIIIKSYFIWKGGGGVKEYVYLILYRYYGIVKLKIIYFKCVCVIL